MTRRRRAVTDQEVTALMAWLEGVLPGIEAAWWGTHAADPLTTHHPHQPPPSIEPGGAGVRSQPQRTSDP